MKAVTNIALLGLVGLLLLGVFMPKQASAQQEERTRILFLLDASGSMTNPWSNRTTESKWNSAKKILTELMDSLDKQPDVEIGLRVYGHLSSPTQRNCQDTRLEAGFSLSSTAFIKTKLQQIKPKGITPITYSLSKAAGDFPSADGRNVIILMTDGVESCEGDPCEVAADLERRGVVLKHFVIGFGFAGDTANLFDCMGSNYTVNDEQGFKSVMDQIMLRILNKTTTQIDLLDASKKPTVTDAYMTLSSTRHHAIKYQMYHTLNKKGLPDTLSLDPVEDYDLIVHTLPPITKQNVTLTPDVHNTLKLPAAQGKLEVLLMGRTLDNNLNNRIKCVVRNKSGILNVQNLNQEVSYLTGKYDLEILTLPRLYLDDVAIKSNDTYTVQIPSPGIVNVQKKYEIVGGIFMIVKGQMEKIYDLASDNRVETIALQPGKYIIVHRQKNAGSSHSTKSQNIEVRSGETLNLNL